MFRRSVLFAALVLLPVGAASAQRARSAATKHDDAKYADDEMAKGPAIRGRDLEDLNPAKLFLDKKKDLKLSDAQVEALKKSESEVKEKNQALYKAIDSLARAMKPPMNPNAESQARLRDARRDLDQTIGTIRSSYDATSASIMDGFEADQKAKATELLAKQKEDADKKIRDKMRGG
jgi:hypothetical protein